MNNKWIFLALGLVSGGAAGFVAGKMVYEKKANDRADQQIAEMAEYYQRADSYARTSEEEVENEVNPSLGADRDKGILSQEERDAIKKKLQDNRTKTTNYAAMYGNSNGTMSEAEAEAMLGQQHPVDSDEDETEEDQEDYNPAEREEEESSEEDEDPDSVEEEEAMEIDSERKANKRRNPKIISVDALGDIPTYYTHETLFYYVMDETTTDENGNVIDDVERLIGDALWKFNFAFNDDETTIYVQNFELDTVYEITKQFCAFYSDAGEE